MKLYVMRHGSAEDQAESGADGDRALTPSGRKRVWDVARALVELGEDPMLLVTSPLVRAVQTAEIVALGTKIGDRGGSVEVRRDMSPGAHATHLAHRLAAEGRKRVMVVGHEPDLSALVAALVGGFDQPFDKAMVVGVHLTADSPQGRLRFVLDPKSLKLLVDQR
jgi:phosphohistidine phosphatase